MKPVDILYGMAAVAAMGAAAIFGGPKLLEVFAISNKNDDKNIDPIDGGNVTINRQESEDTSGGSYALDGLETINPGDATVVTVPFDEPSEFTRRITPNTKEVVFEVPELFVSNESGGELIPTLKEFIVNRNDGTTTTFYVDQFGNRFNSQEELLDFSLKLSDEVKKELKDGTGVSVIEALIQGKPIHPTNFITERPEFFPAAEIDSDFQRRAQALQKTLTTNNPGASSNSRVANFSRLAALGTDLSNIDIFGVQNPDFLGEIKSGQGPLTADQKALVDEVRLRTDPRNMTFADLDAIRKNIAKREEEKTALQKEVEALKKSGLTLTQAKSILNKFGFAINGPVTYELFAQLNDRFGQAAGTPKTTLINDAKTFDQAQDEVTVNLSTAGSTTSTTTALSNLRSFLASTGRTNLDNLAPAELFRLNRSGFSEVDPTGSSSQPAVLALKKLL